MGPRAGGPADGADEADDPPGPPTLRPSIAERQSERGPADSRRPSPEDSGPRRRMAVLIVESGALSGGLVSAAAILGPPPALTTISAGEGQSAWRLKRAGSGSARLFLAQGSSSAVSARPNCKNDDGWVAAHCMLMGSAGRSSCGPAPGYRAARRISEGQVSPCLPSRLSRVRIPSPALHRSRRCRRSTLQLLR
jgi:hypothetical protein